LPELEQKIKDRAAVVGIVGLGYVGLPLAVAFAEAGFRVLGFDMQQKRADMVDNGQSYIANVSSKSLSKLVSGNLLEATTSHERRREADVICICVPTPLTGTKQPDLSYVTRELEVLSGHLQSGQLIVLESTTYPGTTRELALPILERSGLKVGKEFYLAYSPERIDPGSEKYGVGNTPKIVGGIDSVSTAIAGLLYGYVVDEVVTVSGTEVAEMTKIFENVFRNVNIALVNELAQLCEKIGISVWEVIEAASTKPFGYMPFYPGPGVGGHCIPIDPYYLANKANEYDFHTRFIELAADVNEQMPYYVASRIMEVLSASGKSLRGAAILVLGVTYKKNTADTRESPSVKVARLLGEKGAAVTYNDPYIPVLQLAKDTLESVELTDENLSSADCVVIATAHDRYDIKRIVASARLVFDCRGVTRGIDADNIVRLGE